ncbi:unnamed protein product, partial [Mesorhabditis belari]|uniref:Mediator of RNA polymerase II transcription subunit 23 n=1 Tax=Mesorhabditis belari TaxID=2138241 RepID=A0AAF3F0M2_9BILA
MATTTEAEQQNAQIYQQREKAQDSIREPMNRIRALIAHHFGHSDLKMLFWDLSSDRPENDEYLINTVCEILGKMAKEEKYSAVNEMIQIVQQEKSARKMETEMLIDKIFKTACQRGDISPNMCLEGLALTADFTLKTKLDGEKFRYIKENLRRIDYKGVRSLFSRIVKSFSKLPMVLSAAQRKSMLPIEELMLYIMDRKSNLIPSLFVVTELQKDATKVFMFPRLASAATYFENSYRPVAELTQITGRSFLFPLPGHPMFSVSATAWKINGNDNHIALRAVLPYRIELSEPQSYTIYAIRKQPRGNKDYLMQCLRPQTSRTDLTAIIAYLVLETLAEVETLPPDAEIPRYQWENICSIFITEFFNQQISIPKFLTILTEAIRKSGYRKGRDELIWLLLQLVGILPTYKTWIDEIKTWIDEFRELHEACYGAVKENILASSDHPSKMGFTPPQHETLLEQMTYIKRHGESDALKDDAMLAVCANASRGEKEPGPYQNVHRELQQKVDTVNQQQSHPETLFALSYGRLAVNKLEPCTIEFLDSLTIRAKSLMFTEYVRMLTSGVPDRLPSPALLETIAMLCQIIDFERAPSYFYIKILPQLLSTAFQTPQVQQSQPPMDPQTARDLTNICCELLSYRLNQMPITCQIRYNLTITCLTVLRNAPMTQIPPMTNALYFAVEHLMLRTMWWIPWPEAIIYCSNLMKQRGHIWKVFCASKSYTTPATGDKVPPVSPEVVRMFAVNWFRMLKICGIASTSGEVHPEVVEHLLIAYPMPKSQILSFHPLINEINTSIDLQRFDDYNKDLHNLNSAVNQDCMTIRGLDLDTIVQYFRNKHNPQTTSPPQATLLCVAFTALHTNEPVNRLPSFYMILSEMSTIELVNCSNALADYLIYQLQEAPDERKQDYLTNTVRALESMIWNYHFITLDRLLLSLAVHPPTDEASKWGIYIICHLLSRSQFQERVRYYTHNMPPSHQPCGADYAQKLAEFHKRFPELTYVEMLQSAQATFQGMSMQIPEVIPEHHFPIYYGSVIDRILPTADFIVSRTIELNRQLADEVFASLLNYLAPLYKFHPYPITFVYNTLFCLHEIVPPPRAKDLVTAIFRETIHLLEHEPHQPFTASFTQSNHQNAPLQAIVLELAQRFADATEFVLRPPDFVAKDWRFAELSPGVHALSLACIELMASPHLPDKWIQAMISVLCTMKLKRPHQILNALSLILNSLPPIYGQRLANEVLALFDDGHLEDLSPQQVGFSYFEEDCLFIKCTRATAVVALSHAYWFQSNLVTFLKMLSLLEKELFENGRVGKMYERELILMLRLLVPTLQRCHAHCPKECLNTISFIYRLVGEVSANVKAQFEYEDTICDLFYHFKYLYVGDFVKTEAGFEETFTKMHPAMREKLKYIVKTTNEDEENIDEKDTLSASMGRGLVPKISVDVTNQQGGSSGLGSM